MKTIRTRGFQLNEKSKGGKLSRGALNMNTYRREEGAESERRGLRDNDREMEAQFTVG